MVETTVKTDKSKAKASAAFEMPKFEIPRFDMPQVEVPAAFREIAEKGVSQAKESYEKLKVAAEEASSVMEETYATASKGSAEYGLKVIEVARTNTNATFDFYNDFFAVKSFAEAVELSTGFARKQFEAITAQTKALTESAQKVAMEAAEPMKSGFNKAFNKVA
jgi:phasin